MKEQVMQTDRDFAALAQRQGIAEAFRTYAADDATLLPMGETPVTGREAIFTAMSGGPAGTLTWTPVAADVAQGGDLGYTWGRYEFRGTGEDGQPAIRHGKYVTIWKRQPDGSWKYVVDIGNTGPEP